MTGGAGFIGSHLADALLARGDRVWMLDCFEPMYPEASKRRNLETALAAGATLLEVDIRDRVGLEAGFRESAPDVVVHLAARAGVRPSLSDPRLYLSINVDGTLNVLDACRDHGVGNLVFASSSSVYGLNTKTPFSEADPIGRPASPYAASKAAGELICHTQSHLNGLPITCLRFFTVYGPRQRPDMAVHKFARLMREGRPIPVYGEGSARDYTYVDDVIQGVLGAVDRPRPFAVYNLGESTTVPLEEMIATVGRAMGVTPVIERLPSQPGDVSITFADISRARADLGYAPAVPFAEGVARFARWFEAEATAVSVTS